MMNQQDIFYFYNSSIDPVSLIKRNLERDIKADNQYFTNAFGVLLAPEIYPELLSSKIGQVEEPPIPANWHADIAEFGAVFRAIELDTRPEFTMCELGCAWGCWMQISGKVAKKKGFSVHLIEVEADSEFIEIANRSLLVNRFSPDEFSLLHGIIAAQKGTALFPKHIPGQTAYGYKPKFGVKPREVKKYLQSGNYIELIQISLKDILREHERIDLLHVDIQGGEESLIPSCRSILTEKVNYLVIGTHSRQIEGKIFECLVNEGWLLEIERPAILQLANEPITTVDGVQGWRNLKLLPKNQDIELKGLVKIDKKSDSLILSSGEEHFIEVEITNISGDDWDSRETNPIHVSYHWLDKSGNMVVFDGVRTILDGYSINAGETKKQSVKIVAPIEAGEYSLVVTLVHEGKQWFMAPDFVVDSMAAAVN